ASPSPYPFSPRRAGRGEEGRREANQAGTREGSSTIEKRTPALWRFSSETSRQHSSASLRVLNGPLTWAEPSTSLWKFIAPISRWNFAIVALSMLASQLNDGEQL